MNGTNKTASILIVDDEERNRRLLATLLAAEGYTTTEACNGKEALQQVKRNIPDLILLDIMLPEMDGYEVAHKLKANIRTLAIPIIMVTALDDRDARMRGLEAGAEEFITKPVDRSELSIRVRNLLRLREYSNFLTDYNLRLEQQVVERSARLTESYRETIATLVRASAYKDEETGGHVTRISHYAVEIATALGMDAAFCDGIHYASPMHDVGKIAIPDIILLKPGKFEADEWEVMKTHAELGASLLADGDSPYIRMGSEIALSHHERWDGGGYPQGLQGEAIPLPARIMQICDVYDALRSKRPYKPAFRHSQAMEIITRGDGRTQPAHFDPAVFDAFVKKKARMQDIYATYTH